MPSDDDRSDATGSTVAGETTRVAAARYLEGASGHGALSLVFLAVAAVVFRRGFPGVAAVLLLVAYGVAANGLSIYVWDRLRRYFERRFAGGDAAADRTLAPHRVSAEMKAELASGALMVGSFIVVLGVGLWLFRTLGLQRGAVAAWAGLAGGTLLALGWVYLRS